MSTYWIHGHEGHVETEAALRTIWWAGFYVRYSGQSGHSSWVHYAVPTPNRLQNHAIRVRSVAIRYRTGASDAWLGAVHIYDGEQNLARHNGLLETSTDFKLRHYHVPQQPVVRHGLGISLQMMYHDRDEAERDDRRRVIEIAGVAAEFSDPTIVYEPDQPILTDSDLNPFSDILSDVIIPGGGG